MRQLGIQFTGSIVPSWEVPIDDVVRTISDIDIHNPMQIRLLSPGFTRYAFETSTLRYTRVLEFTRQDGNAVTRRPQFAAPYQTRISTGIKTYARLLMAFLLIRQHMKQVCVLGIASSL